MKIPLGYRDSFNPQARYRFLLYRTRTAMPTPLPMSRVRAMAITTLNLSASMPSFTCGVLVTTTSLGVSLVVSSVISTATGGAGKKCSGTTVSSS